MQSLELITLAKSDLHCRIGRRWAWIKGYEGLYQVSDDGLVRSYGRYATTCNTKVFIMGQNLKAVKSGNGSLSVTLYNSKRIRHSFLLSQLVAIAFIPNPLNKTCVLHLDRNKTNNSINNLLWCTRSEASKHATVQFGGSRYNAKLNDGIVKKCIVDYNKGKYSIAELAKRYRVSPQTMGKAISGKKWKHLK